MITFRDMLLLDSAALRGARAPFGRRLLVAALVCAPFVGARAQIALTHMEDASPIPAGSLRFRITTGWSRYLDRFSANGRTTLDSDISTDSLGPRQLPLLLPVESGLKTLTNNSATRLTLGRLDAKSDARTVTVPVSFEYGLTRRISLGMMIPFVQTRRVFHVNVNKDSTRLGNAGIVASRNRESAAATNLAVYAAMSSAADSLGKLVTNCPTNPTASGCAAVNANPADAAAARTSARAFADAVKSALGTTTATTLIAPKTGSAVAVAIDAQRVAIDAQLQKYLGAGVGAAGHVFTNDGDFSYIDLQGRGDEPGLLRGPLGGVDSLRTIDHVGVTGVTLGAQFLVHDGFQYDTLPQRGWHTRLAVGAALRLERVPIDSAAALGSITTSDGQGVLLRTAMDVMSGKLGGTIAAHFDKSFPRTVVQSVRGNPEAFWPYPEYQSVQATARSVIGLDLTPRYFLNEWLALDGHYGLEHQGSGGQFDPSLPCTSSLLSPCDAVGSVQVESPSRTAQRIGFGVRYSTFDSYLRGRAKTPIEVSFTHLTTISGDPGVNALSRDQIQVRLYFKMSGK